MTFPLASFKVFGGFRHVFDVTDTVGVSARQQCCKIALYSGLFRFDTGEYQSNRSCGGDGEKDQEDESEREP